MNCPFGSRTLSPCRRMPSCRPPSMTSSTCSSPNCAREASSGTSTQSPVAHTARMSTGAKASPVHPTTTWRRATDGGLVSAKRMPSSQVQRGRKRTRKAGGARTRPRYVEKEASCCRECCGIRSDFLSGASIGQKMVNSVKNLAV